MNKQPKSQKVYVSASTIKTANGKIQLSKAGSSSAVRVASSGQFITRGELKAAFKSASQKLKSA